MVRWTWVFLDLPDGDADEAVPFWLAVTRATLSPWRGDRSEFATLLPADGDPWLKVQRVGGPGGVHVDLDLDLDVEVDRDEPPAEAARRAVGLGAEVVRELDDVVVCRSPGGLLFCLAPAGREGAPARQARDGAPSLLDQVCLDIPGGAYDREVAFWSGLTGWRVDPGETVEKFERLAAPPGTPVRWLLQRLDDPHGPVRAHVDLSSLDRPAEVARHVALGALEAGEGRGWTVMTDPTGRRYCITDRQPGVEPTASPRNPADSPRPAG